MEKFGNHVGDIGGPAETVSDLEGTVRALAEAVSGPAETVSLADAVSYLAVAGLREKRSRLSIKESV